jgi:hypothetical protein
MYHVLYKWPLRRTATESTYLVMVALFVVVGLVGGDEHGLVGGVALELLAAEALLVRRVLGPIL